MLRIINTNKILEIKDKNIMSSKLQKIHDYEENIINDVNHSKIFTNSISTQTDVEIVDENQQTNHIPNPTIIKNKELNESFNKYIEHCCIVRDDVEVGSTQIIGQYRIWSKTASEEVFHSLKTYLDTRFKPQRLKNQEKDQIVHGYVGVKLKEITYKKKLQDSDEQTFVFNNCIFNPEAKVLFSEVFKEYKHWKSTINKEENPNDEKNLKNYLKDCEYVLYKNVWTQKGNGNGYYGMYLKSDNEYFHKMTATTAKKVEKRKNITDELISSFETIKKAADYEKVCPAKMSRSIKNTVVFNNDYYYCIAKAN